jgi:PAS domain S-box-containing protein
MRHPVFDGAGEFVEVIGTAVDVTERKRAEDEVRASETRFRTSVDHLTDALFIHDDQDDRGRVIDVNQQACDSLGYTREELIGMTAFDYDPSVDVTLNLSIKERLARGEIFSFESVHRRKDGTEFPVEVRARPFWHGDHRFGLALARDITDRKRAEAELERLRQLEADLGHMNRVTTLGELTASLAHEVNQPIAAAVTNANTSVRWLASEIPNIDEAREAAKRAAKDATRAADIINRIRSLFTKGEVQRESVDVNDIINDMIVLLRNEAMRYAVSIRSTLAADLPHVMADRVQLQQVLMNLMANSIDAMKEVSGIRELTLMSQRAGSGQVLVSVTDNGMGLPPDMGQIFHAFFTTKPHGTGMGLAISRTIIESHGGRLWASSNSDRGATFYFTLPTKIEAQL